MDGKLMFVLFSSSDILLALVLILEWRSLDFGKLIAFGGPIILITFIIWAVFIRLIHSFEKVYSDGFLLNYKEFDVLSFDRTQIFIPYNEVIRIEMNNDDIRFSLGNLGEVEVNEKFAKKYNVSKIFKIKRPAFFEFILPRIKEQVDEQAWKKWGALKLDSEE